MQKGILKRWGDEKGFGFILLENSSENIFFHISSLQSSGRRPIVGDSVYFNIEIDENGRKRAANVNIQGVKSIFAESKVRRRDADNKPRTSSKTNNHHPRHHASNSNRILSKFFHIVILLVIVFFIHKAYKEHQVIEPSLPSSMMIETEEEPEANTSRFQCEGKTRCPQMTSCEEAMFYLRNCPGSVTDGDGDGRPCEDQWCGH